MQQPWWTKKISWATGLLGAILLGLLPTIASIIWPVFNNVVYPFDIVTAADAPFATTFISLSVVGYALIVIFLVALWRYTEHQHYTKLTPAARNWLLGIALFAIFKLAFRFSHMTDAVLNHGQFTLRDGFGLVLVVGVGWTTWQVGQTASAYDMQSLTNVLKVFGWLFVIINGLSAVVRWLGWPVGGFLDQFAMYGLLLAIGYSSWYFMRLSA
jgi:hypothetical protein